MLLKDLKHYEDDWGRCLAEDGLDTIPEICDELRRKLMRKVTPYFKVHPAFIVVSYCACRTYDFLKGAEYRVPNMFGTIIDDGFWEDARLWDVECQKACDVLRPFYDMVGETVAEWFASYLIEGVNHGLMNSAILSYLRKNGYCSVSNGKIIVH